MSHMVLPTVECFLNFSWVWNIKKSLVGCCVGVGYGGGSAGQLIFRRIDQHHRPYLGNDKVLPGGVLGREVSIVFLLDVYLVQDFLV